MSKRVLALLVSFLFISSSLSAADLSTTTCPGAGCVTYPAGNLTSATIQISGTFVGTLTFQATQDGTNYVSLGVVSVGSTTPTTYVTTATTPGIFRADHAYGFRNIRVVFTAYTSGTAVITFAGNSR
jgi:hypothetical protein